MTLDEAITGGDAKNVERFKSICREVLTSGRGKELLAIINHAIPPMMSAIGTGPTELLDIGRREGWREMSALLYRYASDLPLISGSPGN